MEALQRLAVLYTHSAEQEGEQQQMQHGCHDHSLGKEGEGGGGDRGDRGDRRVQEV